MNKPEKTIPADMNNKNGSSGVFKRFVAKGVFPHQFAFTLLIPLRNIFLSPAKLIQRLELKENMNVLEIGAGPGYFAVKIADVLVNGKLILADIQKEMLDYAKKRIDKKKLKNVEYYLCDGEKFNFPGNAFDRIFMVTVIGEIENKELYMNEFHRILKPGGILSVSELAGDPDKMTAKEVEELAVICGFKFHKIFGSKINYTVNFIKPG